jgi:pilus assembly protein Flp/PilA
VRSEGERAWLEQTTFRKKEQTTTMIKSFLRDETGLELSEYAVAAALIALAVVGVFTTLGGNIKGVINNLATNIK